MHSLGSLGSLVLITIALTFTLPAFLAAAPVSPDAGDRCPVCGMFVAPYPNWLAQVEFNNGSREFFDGPKDMFRFFLQLPETNNVRSKETIAGIYVTEYYSTKLLEVDKVLFVIGSDVLGPMGKELIPVGTGETAETFKRDHKGTMLLTFEQVTNDILTGIR